MIICVKCGKEQVRRSGAACENDLVIDNVSSGKEHAWEDREEFINELREKLPPFIKERIVELQKKNAEKQEQFNERLETFEKKHDELNAAHAEYLSEGLPRDVEKEKQRAKHSLLGVVIGYVIGVFGCTLIFFKWIFPITNLWITILFIILSIIVSAILFLVKPLVNFFKAKRYAESQEFADYLSDEWLDKNGVNELVSEIEALEEEWSNTRKSFKRVIHDAERALVGSDEELLHFYNKDKKTKSWYIGKIYEGEW